MAKYKLLLADDSITIQKVVNLTFADEGIEVISVGDGDAAMEKLAEITPDLVMADINMPGLTGYEICERIRQTPATSRIPVILLVGSFEPFDEEEARRVGASDFLTKPFQSIRQLVTKVSGLLDSAAENTETATNEIISDLDAPETNAAPGEFDDTLKMAKAAGAAPEEFVDTGMDDEMIQTDQVGGYGLDEMQKLQSKSEIETADDYAKTQPLSAAELDEINYYQSPVQNVSETETSETSAEAADEPVSYEERGNEFVGETAFSVPTPVAEEESFQTEETETASENQYFNQNDYSNQPQEVQFAPAAEADSSLELEDEGNLLELPPRENFSADASSQPIWQEDASFETSETQADETYETKQFVPDGDAQQESVADETTEDNLSEANLVVPETVEEMPEPVEDEDFSENVTVRLTSLESSEPVETETETSKSAETENQASKIENLSPAVIEAIAAKVSEQFSEKVIREIVAEITPQITQLIARRISEENSRE